MFRPKNISEWDFKYPRKAASTAFAKEAVVADNGTGEVEPADGSDTEIRGITLKAVTSADDDYADTSELPILVPNRPNAPVIADVTTGTATEALEGTYVDLDDSEGLDVSSSTDDVFFVTKFINASTVEGYFNYAG